MIQNPILLDRTPAGGLILPVTGDRGGLSGYVLLGLLGPPATAEISTDGGEAWTTLTYPHELVPGEQLRLTRTDTSPLLTMLRALAPLDEGGPPQEVLPLDNGMPVTELSGAQGSLALFGVFLPEPVAQLRVTTSGGQGDVDLYARWGEPPSLLPNGMVQADVTSEGFNTNEEVLMLSGPQTGQWYVGLLGVEGYSGVTLLAAWGESGGEGAPFTATADADGYQTIEGADVSTDQDGYQTITNGTATADVDGYETVERS